jgi:dihydrofolate reductase
MRTVTYGAACSLDGYIARKDHGVDWLTWSKDVAAITAKYWKTIDTVVMGRRTYEAGAKGGYPGVANYVCSRTMPQSPDPGVQLVKEDAARFVAGLKAAKGKGICVMGGGVLARALFEAELIDEVGVNVQPVLLGAGVPMFPESERAVELERVACEPLQGGCVYMLYRVKRSR